MKQVIVSSNQTIYDIAICHYGTCEAVVELLELNQDLANDDKAKVLAGIDPLADRSFYLDLAVRQGQRINIKQDSPMMNAGLVRELDAEVATFNMK